MGSTDSENDILIIGAGVSGLVLAQGLKHRGIPFRIFERDDGIAAKSQGYRFRIVDDAIAALKRTLSPEMTSLIEKTVPAGSAPNLMILDSRSGKETGVMKTPYKDSWPIDRPWFRECLSLGLEEELEVGKGFEKYELLDSGKVKVNFEDGSSTVGRMLVAADGIHSRLRRQMFPNFKHLDIERTTIWGKTPLTSEFEKKFGRPDVMKEHFAIMIDPEDKRRSCLFAPVRWPGSGDLGALTDEKVRMPKQDDYMFWAFNTETPAENMLTEEARMKYIKDISKNWDENLCALFENPTTTYAIPIHSCTPDSVKLGRDQRITFMGDLIHGMSPSGGSGGNTGVVDAAKLCDALDAAAKSGWNAEITKKGIAEYESDMHARAKKAIEFSFVGGKLCWDGKDWSDYREVAH